MLTEIRDLLDELVEQGRTKQPARRRSSTRRTSTPARRERMAQSFIEILLRENGPMTWEAIAERGGDFGHAESTMRRVRHEVAEKYIEDRQWLWRLRDQEGMGNGSDHHDGR